MRTPRAIAAGVIDNAMLYKDITQWLRNRTFLILFFGLLAVAEITTALIVFLPRPRDDLGEVAFSILSGVLCLYAVIIAFLGYHLTAREFFHRTFELYELSGMSLERMVWGKLLSMLTQFFFGFFCLVPFMFVAFMLGGLDFYLVLTVCGAMLLAIVPMYLLALVVALLSRSKHTSAFMRVCLLVLVLLVLPYVGLAAISYYLMMYPAAASPVDFLSLLLQCDTGAIVSALIFMAFYVQICLLLFYACCNAISPITDSRVTALHCIAFLLSASYLGWTLSRIWGKPMDASTGYLCYVPVLLLTLFLGLRSVYGRLDVPVMTAARRRAARFWGTRAIYFLFHPGAVGGCKTLALMYGLFLLFGWLVGFSVVKPPAEFLDAETVALQAPFFLILPGALLILSRFLDRHPAMAQRIIALWWILLGITLMIPTLIVQDRTQDFGATGILAVQTLAVLASPLSSLFVQDERLLQHWRVGLGLAGLLALPAVVRYRLRRASVTAPVASRT